MKHEIKIMTATDLEEANKKAIKLNFNRTLNMEKFHVNFTRACRR